MDRRLEYIGQYRDTALELRVFAVDTVAGIWDEAAPLLQRSVDKSLGMTSMERLQEQLSKGEAKLFTTFRDNRLEAVMVVAIEQYPVYKIAHIIACAGKSLLEAMQFMPIIESWALAHGALEIEAWCRPAMVRLARHFGFKHKFTAVSLDLRRRLQ